MSLIQILWTFWSENNYLTLLLLVALLLRDVLWMILKGPHPLERTILQHSWFHQQQHLLLVLQLAERQKNQCWMLLSQYAMLVKPKLYPLQGMLRRDVPNQMDTMIQEIVVLADNGVSLLDLGCY